MKMQLGTTVRDQITGFLGVVTGRAEYITGCNQALVAPPVDAAGKSVASEWFDEQRLVLVPEYGTVTLDNGKTPGCDKAAPKR
ncbi:MAG TPA: hypothetical protein VFG23_22625 [Polyangia bacterium]|nr:hypothetical protein [Polyangia bacterium]